MSTTTTNRLESTYAGIKLTGKTHALSAWFVVTLRLVMGGMMLFAGLGKLEYFAGDSFNATGYLVHGVDSASPVSGLYAEIAANAVMLDIINVLIPSTQILIGLALIVGGFVRLAAFGGALQMLAFYLGGWEGQWLGLFDNTLVYMVLFLAIGAFAAGRFFGIDRYVEQLDVGGKTLIERYPALRYILG